MKPARDPLTSPCLAAVLLAAAATATPVLAVDDGSVIVTTVPPPSATAEEPAPPEPKPKKSATGASEPAAKASKPKTSASPPVRATAAASPESEKTTAKRASQSIVALVNDEPITAYEIEQRQRLMGLNANLGDEVKQTFNSLIKSPAVNKRLKQMLDDTINANKGKTKDEIIDIFERRKKEYALSLQKQAVESARAKVLPGLRKKALDELIDERLKLQEAKRLNAVADDSDVDSILTGMAERNKMTLEKFREHMKGMGADLNSMRNRFKAELSWREVVRRRFGHMIAIADRDVDRLMAASQGTVSDDEVSLEVQRITLKIPGKIDQSLVARRVAEAEMLASKFTGCAGAAALVAGVPDATHENLGMRKPSSIPEPTRSLLLNARDGEVVPPTVAKAGVELWALCSRKTTSADDKKREVAQAELRQKEFDILAKKHLKDLRLDAAIEYR